MKKTQLAIIILSISLFLIFGIFIFNEYREDKEIEYFESRFHYISFDSLMFKCMGKNKCARIDLEYPTDWDYSYDCKDSECFIINNRNTSENWTVWEER